MKQKNIVATLYLKDGHAVRSMTDFTPVDANVYRLCQLYNDSGVDTVSYTHLTLPTIRLV